MNHPSETIDLTYEDLKKRNATLIGVSAGVLFYEHPVHGDKAPLIAVLPDHTVVVSPWWERPPAYAVLEWFERERYSKPEITVYPPLGTVSHGTMVPADLARTFAPIVCDYNPDRGSELMEDVNQIEALPDERVSDLVNALFDAMNDIAPPYCYFGAHEGDGFDYGFWPLHDRIAEDRATGKITEVAQIQDIPLGENGIYALGGPEYFTLYEVRDGQLIRVFSLY